MINEKTINKVKIKPLITTDHWDPKKVKFGSVFPNPYNTTFLVAKRKSGKTNVLGEILDKQPNKKTVIWLFCPTTNVDSTYKIIIDKLRNKGNLVNIFDGIMDGKTNRLDKIIEGLVNVDVEDDEKTNVKKEKKLICDEIEEEKEKKERKPKKMSPEHIFVFDDLSHELKNPSLYKLLKNGRHIKASVYLSFQYPNDLLPQGWKQCDYALCFKSFSDDKLEHIHKHMDLSIDLDKFIDIYQHVMRDDKYDFLYIDVRNQKYRKNFNRELRY